MRAPRSAWRSVAALAVIGQLLKVFFRTRVSVVGGLLKPLAHLDVVPCHSLTVAIKQAEAGHGLRVALVSGLLVQLVRLDVVLRDAPTVLVKSAEVIRSARIALAARPFRTTRAP